MRFCDKKFAEFGFMTIWNSKIIKKSIQNIWLDKLLKYKKHVQLNYLRRNIKYIWSAPKNLNIKKFQKYYFHKLKLVLKLLYGL